MFPADSQQVTNRMDQQNSLQLHSRMRRSKKLLEKLLNERDGLALGICNGFQALVKLGLVPSGEVVGQTAGFSDTDLQYHRTPYFQDGLHKVVTNKSPWLQGAELGGVYTPTRHPMERDVLLQVKNGWTSCSQTARLQHSTVTLKEMSQWTKNGTSMVLTVQSKVSQARTDVYLVRWRIQKDETEVRGNQHLRRTGYEDLRIRSKILQIMNVQVSETLVMR